MKKDNFFKIMLVIIALLLCLNLFADRIFTKAIAASYPIDHLVCSYTGQHLYAAIGSEIIYSDNFGRNWTKLTLHPWN